MDVFTFLEAVGATIVGHYVCRAVDYAIRLIKDRLNDR